MRAPRGPCVVLADPNIAKNMAAGRRIRKNPQLVIRKNHFCGAHTDLIFKPPDRAVGRLPVTPRQEMALSDESNPRPGGRDRFTVLETDRIGRKGPPAGVPEVLPASPKQERCWRTDYQIPIWHVGTVPQVQGIPANLAYWRGSRGVVVALLIFRSKLPRFGR
jgi:hypothetical protein